MWGRGPEPGIQQGPASFAQPQPTPDSCVLHWASAPTSCSGKLSRTLHPDKAQSQQTELVVLWLTTEGHSDPGGAKLGPAPNAGVHRHLYKIRVSGIVGGPLFFLLDFGYPTLSL